MTKEEVKSQLEKAGSVIKTYEHLAKGGKVEIEMSEEKANLRLEKAKWLLDMYTHLDNGGELESLAQVYKIDGEESIIPQLTMDSITEIWHKKSQ